MAAANAVVYDSQYMRNALTGSDDGPSFTVGVGLACVRACKLAVADRCTRARLWPVVSSMHARRLAVRGLLVYSLSLSLDWSTLAID